MLIPADVWPSMRTFFGGIELEGDQRDPEVLMDASRSPYRSELEPPLTSFQPRQSSHPIETLWWQKPSWYLRKALRFTKLKCDRDIQLDRYASQLGRAQSRPRPATMMHCEHPWASRFQRCCADTTYYRSRTARAGGRMHSSEA